MSYATNTNRYIPAKTLAISCIVVLISFVWQGAKGFNLWDEGFLWYGVQRVLVGEVPIRDFMAYDPGRYYWSAALLHLAGNSGIIGLRAAVALFQVFGLFAGLLLIAQASKKEASGHLLFWLLAAVTLLVWMFPRHKLFDISISVLLIGALAYLVSDPLPRRYFLSGLCVGLAAFFGRNHGMYGAAASIFTIFWLNFRSRASIGIFKGLYLWIMGVTIGFLPIVFMALLVPGFAAAFWDSIRFLFEQKTTNLPLPVPWPWSVNFTATPLSDALRGVLIGLFFVGMLVFALLSFAWLVYCKIKQKPVPPAFVASAFLALPYTHFAYSRADIGHLAQGLFPLLIGSLVLLSSARARVKWPLALLLCGISVWTMLVTHSGWQCREGAQCVTVEISGSTLVVDPGTANDVAMLRQLTDQYAPNGQAFIAAPNWPGAYALLGRKAPMWEIFALFSRPPAFEQLEIERIKAAKPGFAFVFDLPLDGREELRFRNTHPLIHQYILEHFDPVAVSQNPAYLVYKARGAAQ